MRPGRSTSKIRNQKNQMTISRWSDQSTRRVDQSGFSRNRKPPPLGGGVFTTVGEDRAKDRFFVLSQAEARHCGTNTKSDVADGDRSKTTGNCFYHAGELIAQLSAINLIKAQPTDPNDNRPVAAQTFELLCGEIIKVSGDIAEVFGELISILSKDTVEELVTQQVPDGPKLSTFSLPYFFDEVDTLPCR
jgi:hypothetical protein